MRGYHLLFLILIACPLAAETGHPTGHLHDHGDMTWPPQPRGISNSVPLSNPGSDVQAANERRQRRDDQEKIAMTRADVRQALGARHSEGILVESDAKAATPVKRLVYFSHGNNATVEVNLDGKQVQSVRRIPASQYQPDVTDGEIRQAEALARTYFNNLGRERVSELQAYGILAYKPEGRGFYNSRVVYISFHKNGDAPPEFSAWVDLTQQRVLRIREERS